MTSRRALLALCLLTAACRPPATGSGADAHTRWLEIRQPASAQSGLVAPGAAEVAEGWDADALVARALSTHPGLAALRARAAAVQAREGVAYEREPLELRLSEIRLDEIDRRQGGVELALRGRPLRPRTIAARVEAARLGGEEAAAELRDEERLVAAAVRRWHAEVLLAREVAVVAEEEAALRGRERALVADRVAAQVDTRLDLALAELARAEVVAWAAAPRGEAARALAQLRAELSVPADAPLTLRGSPGGTEEAGDEALSRERLIEEALAARPEIAGAGARLAGADVALWEARSERLPWLSFVQVGYDAKPASSRLSWGFALGIDVPLWQWGGHRVRAAQAERARRVSEQDARIRAVVADVDRALAAVGAARNRLKTLDEVLVPAAEQAAEAALAAREAGALDPMRALSVQAARLSAARRRVEARRELVMALLDLHEAVGRR